MVKIVNCAAISSAIVREGAIGDDGSSAIVKEGAIGDRG
jgi:hypothetical protein